MISFYPGPSRIYDEVPAYVKEAHKQGILSMNHRSEVFMDLYKETVSLLRQKLEVPKNYSVFFTSSATECWEIIAQSLIKEKSVHLFNGAFGEKWFQYTQRLSGNAHAIRFEPNQELNSTHWKNISDDLICVTQNETSNGTQVSNSTIAKIKRANPSALLAVDATSSMAGIYLNFKAADIWFASVQKCFGLPAGLALLICSPKAIERAQTLGENRHYNSMVFMKEMLDKWQTSYTPNVLGIYLLMRVLRDSNNIKETESILTARAQEWHKFFGKFSTPKLYIENEQVRSSTVITLTAPAAQIEKIKKTARKNGFLLGEGYGKLKPDTLRIANFPALKNVEVSRLQLFFKKFLSSKSHK